MKRFFAVLALTLFIAAPLAQNAYANGDRSGSGSIGTQPPGEILD